MSSTAPQTLANHARLDPLYHFVLVPGLIFLLIWTVINAVRHQTVDAIILAVLLFLVLLITFKFRAYALKVQDRVIRLEERLRFAALLPETRRSQLQELSESQLIALRFASDSEAPRLATRALDERLNAKAIKTAIQNWRPDLFRV